MLFRSIGLSAAALVLTAVPASADPGDRAEKDAEKAWEKRAQCDEKLAEAKSRKDFYQKAAECNRELAKLDREQRREAAKEWREAEKKWRERNRYYDGRYYDWND